MKKHFLSLFLVLLVVACTGASGGSNAPNDDDTDGNDGAPTGVARFEADIEGTALNAQQVDVSIVEIDSFERIIIVATNSDTAEQLQLTLPRDLETGSYDFDTAVSLEKVSGVFKPDYTGAESFVSQSGVLTITRISAMEKTIEGNAVFTLANPTGNGVIEVTFCEFLVVY